MAERDLTELLLKSPKTSDGRYRAVASLYLEGKSMGEFRYFGTRSDDPNDIVPHEHRRDLRGLRVFCAWLGHDDSRAINTLDMLVETHNVKFIKHHLIDFGATLGSDSYRPNSPGSGNDCWFAWDSSAAQLFSLGLYVPRWMRAHYPNIPAVGRFEAEVFDPEKWVPFYPCPAFDNCLPDDAFWAAKQIMAFTDGEVRGFAKTRQYSDARAAQWISQCLIERRDKIGKAYFTQVLPLDGFEVRDRRLAFEDLATKYKLAAARDYTVQWSQFDNEPEKKTPLAGEASFKLPRLTHTAAVGAYFAADIHGNDPQKMVTVYLRKKAAEMEVVGIDRSW